jgi:hypothetical protein
MRSHEKRSTVASQVKVAAIICPLFEMDTMKNSNRCIAAILIFSTTVLGLPLSAQAGMVSTDAVLTVAVADADRGRVNDFLQRADVRQALEAQGVAADAALERVQALTDAEVSQIAGRIGQAPAGGDVLGLVFTVFLLLLVTDILGLTKVYPFTRSVR